MTDTYIIDDYLEKGMHAFAVRNYEESIDLFTSALEADATHKRALMSRGSAFLKLDRLDDAISDFSRVIETEPGYARAYHLRGLAREKGGERESAVSDFDRALEIEPEYGAAYYSRAALHSKSGKIDRAMGDIEAYTHVTARNLESFNNENNVWQTRHMVVEEFNETELMR